MKPTAKLNLSRTKAPVQRLRQCRPRSHSLRLGRPRSHRLQLDRASSSSREWSTSRAPETSTQPRISSSPTCSRSASKSTLITPRCRSRMPAASLHVQSRAVCNCQIGRRQMSRLLQRDQRKWNACDFFMAHPRVLSPLCWHALPSAHLNFMRCTNSCISAVVHASLCCPMMCCSGSCALVCESVLLVRTFAYATQSTAGSRVGIGSP